MRGFDMPGLLFERFESLLLVIWIMQMFTCFNVSHYAASLGLAQLFKKNIHPFMFGLLPVIYIISMTPKNTNDLFKLGDTMGNVAFFLFGIQPPLLLLVLKLKKRKYKAIS
jgi:spore germination protein